MTAAIAEGLSEEALAAVQYGCCASDDNPTEGCICAFDYDELIDLKLAEVRQPDIGPRGIFLTELGLLVRAHLLGAGE